MAFLSSILSFFLHIDTHLASIIEAYGTLTYVILFAIILCETGLVVMPFLPGDSLLFAAGALAGKGDFNIYVLFILLFVAAVCGDALNFYIGSKLGNAAFARYPRIFKQDHLKKTNQFFATYGNKTIVIARFMPIVRTLAPFVAGVGQMQYSHFVFYNVFGALLWLSLFLGCGYFFGSLPFVEKNFSFVILVIIILSVLPALYEWWKGRRKT